ncbi:MAG: metal-dependent hydrolase [Planctomycetaceae bacterium]|nr:metal-dependent hydrolase [Planctomycetaceae bacterium]MCB9954092.1 metal-dependent hydrolase [Planctomycetaceae bacterium]
MTVDNLPLITKTFGDLTVEGYSRGAVQTYWRIPELKLGFDMGGSPWSFMGTQTFLISHAHLDHLAALPAYVARRRMMKMEPPTIYLPASVVDHVERMLKSWQKLDRGRMVCNLVPVTPGEEFELSREHVVTAFETKHTVPSVGYVVWDRRKKLKAEFTGMSGSEIRDIRLSGTEVSEEVRYPLVSYTGDTAPQGLDADPANYLAKILITEMTFYRPEHRKEKIHKFGHMHLDDILERADRFQNEAIILAHFTTRDHINFLKRAVERRMPESLRDRVHLWV